MQVNIGKEVAAMGRMSMIDLRSKYAEVFGESTAVGNRVWLIKRIAWRMQALAEGDLSVRARQRALELANDADLRLMPPRPNEPSAQSGHTTTFTFQGNKRVPMAGSVITKQYKGQTLAVKVLARGFEFEGEVYKSLSALANKITGSHCSGHLFFGINKQEQA